MSGVRNLRAMFEQRGETPPDRGRSPGPGGLPSVGSPSPSDSPRPLSKVRTTFVAIEKDGRVGLKREPSGDSVSVSSRRLSNDTEVTTPQPAPEKPDFLADSMAKNNSAFKTNISQEAIPESPMLKEPPTSSKKESPSPNIAPNANPDKVIDEEEPKTTLLPGNPTDKAAVRGKSTGPARGTNGAAANGKAKSTAPAKSAPKAAPISTSAKPVSKAPKSPNTAKPSNGGASKATANAPSLAPQKKAAPASKDHDVPKKTTAPASTKAQAPSTKKPPTIDLPPSGFVKPKVKSPTRPVKLPASLTAPTAAYASKLGTGTGTGSTSHPPRQSLSRGSGNAQHLNVGPTLHRSSSRASMSNTGTTSNAKPLKRQSSTISRPRPSLGPPPKQTAKDHPVSKKDGQVDEGFLARMMRPTQSSSSKTSDKAPATPPRKQNAPAPIHKKPVVKDPEGGAKKVAAKIQSSTNKVKAAAETTKPADKEAATAEEVAPVVAQVDTAEAAIGVAKVTTDTAVTPAVEKAEAEAVPEATSAESGKEEVKADPVEESAQPEAAVPAVTEDPSKVEDIEDVVQEAAPEPIEEQPAEPVAEPIAEPTTTTEETKEQPASETKSEPTTAVTEDNSAVENTETEEGHLNPVEPEVQKHEEAKVEAPIQGVPELKDVETNEAKVETPQNDA
ncbi:hypothetical protein GGR52DRAFT_588838 [Hypoxylon sp. FL1284]|nr:hypothetical protein GGR52DRAFT_588838 [Hypoxylon sp. FL1284]